ncbi:uncharacterized protein BO88DRAFT_416218 [Aspergillus vadensis CBS 113365]|uniref:Uncharacterized protein n=1 Tax=Aspergillus vadensis (strain CBS 113365 / IMI 142717 / IBT 24658) TaxID=1448311 RepID=A0A319B5X4_ASPVC|nr:hypothetical protein BO88DRAFT_416218 [Aspergillus vadensis CBS 113365]PYH67845.1 hypothetical protein BO88DRAFT_416218 [Aspergillus vadensis CBS 113365]
MSPARRGRSSEASSRRSPRASKSATSRSQPYGFGSLSGHDIVIIALPAGVYGTISATSAVVELRRKISAVKLGLLFGICSVAPGKSYDNRLANGLSCIIGNGNLESAIV